MHERIVSAYLLGAGMYHALCEDELRSEWLDAAFETECVTPLAPAPVHAKSADASFPPPLC